MCHYTLLLELREPEAQDGLVTCPASCSWNLMPSGFQCRPPLSNLFLNRSGHRHHPHLPPSWPKWIQNNQLLFFWRLENQEVAGVLRNKAWWQQVPGWLPSSSAWCLGTPALGSERPVFEPLLRHTHTCNLPTLPGGQFPLLTGMLVVTF